MKRIMLLIFLFIFGWALNASLASAATLYSGAWSPTDETITEMSFDLFGDNESETGLYEMWLYDWTGETPSSSYDIDRKNKLKVLFADTNMASYIEFTPSGDDYSVIAYDTNTGWTIDEATFTNDDKFGVYFEDIAGNKYFEYTYEQKNTDSDYNLSFTGKDQSGDFINVTVAQHDASPVPVPAAAWILGAGLLGLVGYRKKFELCGHRDS